MNTAEWIAICIMVAAITALVTWGITYAWCDNSRTKKCSHDFEKVIEVDRVGVHKVAYLCHKCGLVKKVQI